jgi:SUN domain-containing protein 1/2
MEVWAMVEGQDNVAKLEAWRAEMPQGREHELPRPKMLPKSPEYIRIASFQYDIHSPNNVQTFPVDGEIRTLGIDFGVVVLVIKSNWGMDEYTCLYRIRVHGQTMDP